MCVSVSSSCGRTCPSAPLRIRDSPARCEIVLLPGALGLEEGRGGGGGGDGDGVGVGVFSCVCRRSWSLTHVAPLRDFLRHRQVFEPSVTPSAGSVVYNPRTKKTPPNWPTMHLEGRAAAELL